MCPSLRGLTCHRPSRRGISQNLPVAVGGFTRVWEGFSWVMVPGVGVVLNTGQLTSWAGGYCWFE